MICVQRRNISWSSILPFETLDCYSCNLNGDTLRGSINMSSAASLAPIGIFVSANVHGCVCMVRKLVHRYGKNMSLHAGFLDDVQQVL